WGRCDPPSPRSAPAGAPGAPPAATPRTPVATSLRGPDAGPRTGAPGPPGTDGRRARPRPCRAASAPSCPEGFGTRCLGRLTEGRSMLRPHTTQPRFPLFRPRHHRAQLGAHLLDRMLRAGLAQRREPAAPAPAFCDPLARETAGLDVGQNALHRGVNFRRYDLGAAGVVAVLRGVAD